MSTEKPTMETKIEFPDRKILAVYAENWSINDGPTDVNYAFYTYCAWVVGFLIRETRDSITLGPELFDDKVRRSQTIPRSAIRRIVELEKIQWIPQWEVNNGGAKN